MQAGQLVNGRFELERPLGTGGFAAVWRAREVQSGARYALKFLTDATDEQSLVRFSRESRVIAQIEHQNCVRVFEHGTSEFGPYLVLEYVDGQSLAELRGRQLPIEMVVNLACQIADGLSAARDKGVSHRDLKPENVVLTTTGIAKVLDFGIAKVRGVQYEDVTKTGEIIGTPQYMSPEQLRGLRSVGPATDQYSLGVMLYELLEGRLPFSGSSLLEIAMAHIHQPPPPITRPDCPPALRDCILRLLAKEPHQRFADVRQVVTSLRGSSRASGEAADMSNRSLGLVAGGLLVVVALVAALALGRDEPEAPRVVVIPTPAATVPSPAPSVPKPSEPEPEDAGVVVVPDGCGDGDGTQIPEDRRAVRYVPSTYEVGRKHRLFLILTANEHDAGRFVADSGIQEIAEDHRFVIVAPNDKELDSFNEQHVLDIVRTQTEDLCVDRDNVVVMALVDRVSHGLRFVCSPWVAALIHHSRYRFVHQDDHCENGRVVPELAITPLKSKMIPPEGGLPEEPCRSSDTKVPADIRPLADTELRRQKIHGCEGEPVKVPVPDGFCFEQTCEVPYRSCHTFGSQYWPGTGGTMSKDLIACEPQSVWVPTVSRNPKDQRLVALPIDFPANQELEKFIASLPPVEQ